MRICKTTLVSRTLGGQDFRRALTPRSLCGCSTRMHSILQGTNVAGMPCTGFFVHHRRHDASPTATSSIRATHNYDAPLPRCAPALDSRKSRRRRVADALFSLFSAISWQGYSPAQPRVARSTHENSTRVRLSPLLATESHVQRDEKIGGGGGSPDPFKIASPSFFRRACCKAATG